MNKISKPGPIEPAHPEEPVERVLPLPEQETSSPTSPQWIWSVFLLAIIGVGAFLRLYRLPHAPPGFFIDEAADGLDAERILHGEHPVFFGGENAREPLTFYLQALVFAFTGPGVVPLRLTSALIGISTIPALYFLGKRMFSPQVGLLAAATTAVLFWPLSFSRIGFRAISLPLVVTLALAALWRALFPPASSLTPAAEVRHGWHLYWRWLVAGLLVGLSAYTYLSARFVPIALALFLLYALISSPVLRGKYLAVCLFTLSAGLTFAPLALYFLRHPADFNRRVDQVSWLHPGFTLGQAIGRVGNGILTSLLALGIHGDISWRHNYNEQPLFPPLLFLALAVGASWCIWQVRPGQRQALQAENAPTRLAAALLLVWSLVMMLPAALSDGSNSLRLLGALPSLVLLVAVGLREVARFACRLVRKSTAHPSLLHTAFSPALLAGLAVLLFLITTVNTYATYFGRWATDDRTYRVFEGDIYDAIHYANHLPAGSTILFPQSHDSLYSVHRLVAFLGSQRQQFLEYDPQVTFVLPVSPSKNTYFLFPAIFQPQGVDLSALYGAPLTNGLAPTGGPGFLAYSDSPTLPLRARRPSHTLNAQVGVVAQVLGYDLSATQIRPGDTAMLTLYWRTTARTSGDYHLYIHLLDEHGQAQGGLATDDASFPSSGWRPGMLAISRFQIKLNSTAPPGPKTLAFGIYDSASGARLPVTGAHQVKLGTQVQLARVLATRPGTRTLSLAQLPGSPVPLAHPPVFGNAFQLTAVALGQPRAGKPLLAVLRWQSLRPATTGYTVFLHLLDAQGRIVAQSDAQPQTGSSPYPTDFWQPSEVIDDLHTLMLPPTLASGALTLVLGVYDAASNQRLSCSGCIPLDGGNVVVVGTIGL